MSTQATLAAVPYSTAVCSGDNVQVHIVLRVQGDAVNAAQGTLRFDPGQLRVTSVSTGRSVFRFWAVQPSIDNEKGTVTFAGGLPTPGFNDGEGLLLTVNVVPSGAGQNLKLTWDSSSIVLLNDGAGTPADTTLVGATLNVSEATAKTCAGTRPTPTPVVDSISPEPFDVVIARSDDAFQGQYFASYYAYDADSGVVRYEVRENGEAWQMSWSPYVLHTQKGQVLVEVKAIDAFGNQRISSSSATLDASSGFSYGPWWFWLIALIGLALGVWRILAYRRKQTETKPATTRPDAAIPRVVYDQMPPMEK